MRMKNTKGQQEMVGFAIIMIMVAVILLVFLGFSLNNSDKDIVENYEVSSFIQSLLQYNTQCHSDRQYLEVKDLIFSCSNQQNCENGENSCELLNNTMSEIIDSSWNVNEDSPIQGYEFFIYSNGEALINLEKGNTTQNYKGSVQDYTTGGNTIEIMFKAFF